jgi:hypothetical protein
VNPLRPLSAALNSIRLAYVVIGSVASGARGIPRTTKDIDLIVRIATFHVDRLAAALGKDWYADPQQMREGIQGRRAFNVIHIPSSWKVDLFPAETDFHESEIERATITPVTIDGDTFECPVSSSEDVVLAKLCWFKEGRGVSEVQWRDIRDVMAASRSLDLNYLRRWATILRVNDVLDRALAEDAARSPQP